MYVNSSSSCQKATALFVATKGKRLKRKVKKMKQQSLDITNQRFRKRLGITETSLKRSSFN